MDIVALPAGSQAPAARAETSRGRVAKASTRLEKAQATAVAALGAVASYLDADEEPAVFFGRLGETLAGMVGARRVAFWRLGGRGVLSLQPQPFGFKPGTSIQRAQVQLASTAGASIERVVFRDELVIENGTAPELDALWRGLGMTGLKNSIAASWRAGNRRLGAIAAYDSRRGFTFNDVWLLQLAALATGLLWQYKEAKDELGATALRLEKAVAARKRLLSNIASGGDEARRRFASALHDDSLQLLTAAALQLERIRAEAQGSHQAVQLDHLRVTLLKVEDSLRLLLVNVSSEVEVTVELNEAISERLEALRIQSGIEPHIDLRLPDEIPPPIQSILLKNIGEALTNVEKHGHATRVLVSAEAVDGGIRVEVVDDGTGFVVAESLPGHVGLISMKERSQLAGGWCTFESEPGAGARVEFWIPKSL